MTMAPKVALITGTNSGTGLATSFQLCKAGYTTYATVRSLSKPDALKQVAKAASVIGRLTAIEMVVGDGRWVATAVKDLLVETENTIDVVVANAGYGDVSPPEVAQVSAFENNLNVNLQVGRRPACPRSATGDARRAVRPFYCHLLPDRLDRRAHDAGVREDQV